MVIANYEITNTGEYRLSMHIVRPEFILYLSVMGR